MTGLEGAAAGVTARALTAAAKRYAATTEFTRLCERLADRFAGLGWSEAHFNAWDGDDAFMAALATFLDPPHESDRGALVAAITPLVGPVDSETSAEMFASVIADAITEEIRFAKQGDSLLRSELDGLKKTVASIGTGSDVRSLDDAFDGLDEVARYLDNRDDHFSYVSIAGGRHEVNVPDSIMRVERVTPAGSSRIDVVPTTDEALERYGPQVVVRAAEGDVGQRAFSQLHDALHNGTGVDILDGLTVEFTRMPPAFAELVGRRVTGRVRLGPAVDGPVRVWPVCLKTKTDRRTASVGVDLRPSASVPNGWEAQLVGRHGGMNVTALFREVDGRGHVQWRFVYARDASPLREQVEALRFLDALGGTGQLIVATRGSSKEPKLCSDTPAAPNPSAAENLLAFLEAVLVIQDWADVEYQLAEAIRADEVRAVLQVAHTIVNRGHPVTWHNWTANVPKAQLREIEEGNHLRVTHTLLTSVLGREVVLGKSALEMVGFAVTSVTPSADPGRVDVVVEPVDEQSKQTFQHLFKDEVPDVLPNGRRPPPPSPRRHRKTGSSKQRRTRRRSR